MHHNGMCVYLIHVRKQALLRLGRARSTDEELQYKAALTVGHLASNAVKLLPSSSNHNNNNNSGGIGTGVSMMQRLKASKERSKVDGAASKGQKITQEYMDMKLAG